MAQTSFTIIDQGTATDVAASIDGDAVRVSAAGVQQALGWKLEPRGFCKDGVCLQVRGGSEMVNDAGVDLAAFAAALDRPVAIDTACRAAAVGSSVAARTVTLESLAAPDFTLPDIHGKPHSLSQHRGKKVLLVAFASW